MLLKSESKCPSAYKKKEDKVKGENEDIPRWYAVKSSRPVMLAEKLNDLKIETYLPVEILKRPDGSLKKKPLIPKLLFIKTSCGVASKIENESRNSVGGLPSLWIYRYHGRREIQPIGEAEFRLFRLLTAEDSMRCEVYHKEEFKVGDRLRVKDGPFKGYEGYARRIKKNKHIIVEIEGMCAIALPFIHPDLLEKVAVNH